MSELKGKFRVGVDIGGTFTDVVLEHGDALTTAKVLTTPDAPDEAVLTGVDDVLARSGVDPRGSRASHPRDHSGHQRDHRAQGCAHRARDHRRIPGRARYRLRKPLRPVRHHDREAAGAGAARAQARGAGAGRCERPGVEAPGRGGGRRSGCRACPARGRKHRDRFPPQLRQPRPRAPGRGRSSRRSCRRSRSRFRAKHAPRYGSTSASAPPLRTPTCSPAWRAISGDSAPGSKPADSRVRCCS